MGKPRTRRKSSCSHKPVLVFFCLPSPPKRNVLTRQSSHQNVNLKSGCHQFSTLKLVKGGYLRMTLTTKNLSSPI